MGILGNSINEKLGEREGYGKFVAQCGTLYCSFLRFEEFKRSLLLRPIDERVKIVPSMVIPNDQVYYVNEFGNLAIYKLEAE